MKDGGRFAGQRTDDSGRREGAGLGGGRRIWEDLGTGCKYLKTFFGERARGGRNQVLKGSNGKCRKQGA